MLSPALVRDDGSDRSEIGRRETISQGKRTPQELGQLTVFSLRVHWGPLILSRFPARENPVSGKRRSFTGKLRVVGKALLGRCVNSIFGMVLEQCQGRIEVTMYEQASHDPHPESFVAPTGFA